MQAYYQQLNKLTGFKNFRPGQLETLTSLESNDHVLSILATGQGKTLIYTLYQAVHPGLCLVVSPLIALMEDQVSQLKKMGIKKVAALNSQLAESARISLLDQLASYQFLFISPEMLHQHSVLKQLQKIKISLFVVDEAHCLIQWGYDFRPAYSQLGWIRQALAYPKTLALTATASQADCHLIKKLLFRPEECMSLIKKSSDRPNIFYHFQEMPKADLSQALLSALDELPKPGLVYVHNKKEANQLSQLVSQALGLKTAPYHGDQSSQDRQAVLAQYLNQELDVIFATAAFGMGINQQQVRFVIHYHLPRTIKELSQEMGRAGRDGQQALALVFYNRDEFNRLNYFYQQKKEQESHFLSLIAAYLTGNLSPANYQHLDEADQNLLSFYQHHFDQVEAAQCHYQTYLAKQASQIAEIYHLLTRNHCYRQELLAHFDDYNDGENAFCCSHCQAHFKESKYYREFLAMNQVSQSSTPLSWQKRLAQLFN
ncbi:hypothetical protein AWM75_06805 [Aerococcus urinaehominis]|uniref:Recombinase RecQ n=1 Tax=Aerococcus urinaehominis TaxID=128944 RepID=A0A0X8FLX7_9LACT|nr:RecQ family ATP-dependent DNA helicase [Aerococcus urinaehominis]AMB99710.1 hypothetical protein AWM75_06805 [Aerococcus urinaehominis]